MSQLAEIRSSNPVVGKKLYRTSTYLLLTLKRQKERETGYGLNVNMIIFFCMICLLLTDVAIPYEN